MDALRSGEMLEESRPGQVAEISDFSPATVEQVLTIHDPNYVAAIQKLAGSTGVTVLEQSPTYATASTPQDALLAAGSVLALVDAVMAAAPCTQQQQQQQQLSPTGFAVCRPPGHHAVPKAPMGFCVFSNASIAARYAQQRHGASRVAVYDFDVHHGNGTNDCFVDDPSVLFISTHQAGLYPSTGRVNEVGTGEGKGATINVPLPGDSGHEVLLAAFEEIVAPAIRRFQPDLLLVSAGYDAHWRDPLAGMQLRTSTYHELGARLRALAEEVCQGRIVFVLEGGYDLKALGESVENTWLGVLGELPRDKFNPDLLRDEPLDKAWAVIDEAKQLHGL